MVEEYFSEPVLLPDMACLGMIEATVEHRCGFRFNPATHSDLVSATCSDRIPATHSNPVPATCSDLLPATPWGCIE